LFRRERACRVVRLKGNIGDEGGWENTLYRNQQPSSQSIEITAIPYDAWDNRTPGEMRIWMRAQEA
jgi:uncharacterized protein